MSGRRAAIWERVGDAHLAEVMAHDLTMIPCELFSEASSWLVEQQAVLAQRGVDDFHALQELYDQVTYLRESLWEIASMRADKVCVLAQVHASEERLDVPPNATPLEEDLYRAVVDVIAAGRRQIFEALAVQATGHCCPPCSDDSCECEEYESMVDCHCGDEWNGDSKKD